MQRSRDIVMGLGIMYGVWLTTTFGTTETESDFDGREAPPFRCCCYAER
jgi:hypothetical protein